MKVKWGKGLDMSPKLLPHNYATDILRGAFDIHLVFDGHTL